MTMRVRSRVIRLPTRPYVRRFAGVWLAAGMLTVFTLVFMLWLLLHLPSIQDGIFIFPQPPQRLSGRPVQMLYRLERDADASGWTPERLRLAGDLWREIGDLRRTFAYWGAAARIAPSADLLRDLAQTALELQEWAAARAALDGLLAASPGDSWAQLQRGILEAVLGDGRARDDLHAAAGERAYADLARALLVALDTDAPTDGARALRVGGVLAGQELWGEAALAFSAAAVDPLASADLRAEAYGAQAWARARVGLSADDARAYALALAPDNPRVRLFEGLTRRADGDEVGSLRAMQAAVALAPDDASLMAELSVAYSRVDEYDSARNWMTRAAAAADNPEQAARYTALLDDMAGAQIDVETALLQQLGLDNLEMTNAP